MRTAFSSVAPATRALALALIAVLSIAGGIHNRGSVQAQSPVSSDAIRRSFVYTITNPDGPNAIAAYEANAETGELVFLATYPTGGRGNGRIVDSQSPLVLDTEGSMLFAVNPGSDDISVMAMRDDGSLELLSSPVHSRGVEPASLALSNNLLYVANKGDAEHEPSYAGFFVQADGSLTRVRRRIALSQGDNPTQVLFNRGGNILIGIRFGSRGLDSFTVRSNGRLRFLSELSNQRGPFAAQFNPADGQNLIVADARLPGASSYHVSETGSLSFVESAGNSPERAACWIVAHPDGSRAWVSNTGTHSLSLYTVGTGGVLSFIGSHRTADFGRSPFELALGSEGRFLYQLNVGAGFQSIHALRVTDDLLDGGLADIGAIGLPRGGSPIGLVVVTR
ncbi:MAG TPA: hypothetical protein VLM38_11670 [Blastocatellia bacterium]|nr:hypothetical protein [Blastocatellia bacterium]